METELVGTVARLPDGQPVSIEILHKDGYATVRRIGGERIGRIALCAVEKLELVKHDSSSSFDGINVVSDEWYPRHD